MSKCRHCGQEPRPWYVKLVQSVGDVLLGRRYWRNRAQQHERGLIELPMFKDLIIECDRYRAENKNLRLLIGDTHLSILWFEEAKKLHAEVAQRTKDCESLARRLSAQKDSHLVQVCEKGGRECRWPDTTDKNSLCTPHFQILASSPVPSNPSR